MSRHRGITLVLLAGCGGTAEKRPDAAVDSTLAIAEQATVTLGIPGSRISWRSTATARG